MLSLLSQPCVQQAPELVVVDMRMVGMTQEPFLRDNWGAELLKDTGM